MYYKFSRLAKIIIKISAILTVSTLFYHIYNVYRMIQTNKLIFDKMEEENVLRVTAISYLEKDGFNLFLGGEFSAIAGIILCLLALFSLYKYSKSNSFSFAIAASFSCLLTTFISGILLFYVILSGKSEIAVETGKRTFQNKWERYVNSKSKKI